VRRAAAELTGTALLTPARRVAAEFTGTALLAAAVSGPASPRPGCPPHDAGVQLLENSTATALALGALI